jgi:hypothetical protein
MGYYAPRARYVELFIRGSPRVDGQTSRERDGAARMTNEVTWADYAGIYIVLEKVKRGKERVNIAKLDPEDALEPEVTGGYIFKKDRLNPGEKGFHTTQGLKLAFEEPKERDITPAQRQYLTNFVNKFERVLFSADFRGTRLSSAAAGETATDAAAEDSRAPGLGSTGRVENPRSDEEETGYGKYIEVDSFIDFHWLVEVARNVDGYWFSQYYHKDRGGKLKMGPTWDWDMTFGNARFNEAHLTSGWRWPLARGPGYRWYKRLFQDPDFLQRYIDRWSELRTNVLATSNVLARVDALAGQVREAQARNYKRWPTLGKRVHPNYFVGQTYEEEVNWLKDWIKGRLDWIDSQGYPGPVVQIVGGGERNTPSPLPSPHSMGRGDAVRYVVMACLDGKIYYTLDGSDPRLPGGAISRKALEYKDAIALKPDLRVMARVRSEYGLWSAPALIQLP